MLIPREKTGVGIIIEFKVFHSQKEKSLEDTAVSALKQIEKKQYAKELEARGILPQQIHVYGFAFERKRVLIAGK